VTRESKRENVDLSNDGSPNVVAPATVCLYDCLPNTSSPTVPPPKNMLGAAGYVRLG